MMGTTSDFKVGDKVVRKADYRGTSGWPYGADVLEVMKLSPRGGSLQVENCGTWWSKSCFDLYGAPEASSSSALPLFKVGDKVRRKVDQRCGFPLGGEICTVTEVTPGLCLAGIKLAEDFSKTWWLACRFDLHEDSKDHMVIFSEKSGTSASSLLTKDDAIKMATNGLGGVVGDVRKVVKLVSTHTGYTAFDTEKFL